jgi:uncharacterized membrane protein
MFTTIIIIAAFLYLTNVFGGNEQARIEAERDQREKARMAEVMREFYARKNIAR